MTENPETAVASGSEPDGRRGDERIDRWLWWGAIVVAVVVRVLFLADKPFWRDEAWVALSAGDPLRSASDGRAAPLGYLAVVHLLSRLPLLPPEISYRLLSLGGGIALVPLLSRLATSLGAPRRVGILAMWLAAGLQPLVYYSRELKSYGLDALLAAALPLLGFAAFGTAAASAHARTVFLAVAVLVPWLSFGGVFTTGAVFAWGWLAWWWRGDRQHRRAWVLCSAAFLGSFLVVYLVALDSQANDPWMQRYWRSMLHRDDRYALPLRFAAAIRDYIDHSLRYFFPKAWPAVLAASIVGALTWPRAQRGYLAFLYLGGAAVCATAVVTDHYLLIAGRLLLMAAPIPLLWSAQALHIAGRAAGRAGALAALAVAMVFAVRSSAQSVRHRMGPTRTDGANFFRFDVRHEVDRLIEAVGAHVPDGRPVLVSRRTAYMFQFYNRGRWRGVAVCRREDERCDVLAKRWILGLKDQGWILLTDEEMNSFARRLEQAGLRSRQRASTGSIRLWEVEREAGSRHSRDPRAGKKIARKPAKQAAKKKGGRHGSS